MTENLIISLTSSIIGGLLEDLFLTIFSRKT